MIEVKALINDFGNDPEENDHIREETRDRVEQALLAAGIDAQVSMCQILNNEKDELVVAHSLVITSNDATAKEIKKAVEGCDSIGGFVKKKKRTPSVE